MRKIEKHYINFIEDLLYNYKFFDIHIKNLKKMLDDIDKGISLESITYDKVKVSPTNKIQNSVMNKAIDITEAKKEIELEIYSEKRLKKILDTILNNLSPDIKNIIELKYMNKMSWDNIVDRVYCNKKTAMKYRDIALNSIAVGLFGSKIYRDGNPTLFDLIEM